jgi:hypothetical protein
MIRSRLVLDASSSRDGGAHAHDARAWLLQSPDFLLIAFYAGSDDPETLRAQIRASLDSASPVRSARRVTRITVLTAPAGMPFWEIVERTSRRAHAE